MMDEARASNRRSGHAASEESGHAQHPGINTRLSEKMTAVGIVQLGNPLLTTPTRPFDLPRESREARQLVAALTAKAALIERIYAFPRGGMGIAAPQIGVGRSAAVFRPSYRPQVVLINPVVVEASESDDNWCEDSEGCLSFFDYRGIVRRPRTVVVAHQELSGEKVVSVFRREREARDVLHEIDHLSGVLYTGRMADGAALVRVGDTPPGS